MSLRARIEPERNFALPPDDEPARALGTSWRKHIQSPHLLLIVTLGSLAAIAIAQLGQSSGARELQAAGPAVPAEIAKWFAPLPLGAFGDLSLADRQLWLLGLLAVLKLGVLSIVVLSSIGALPTRRFIFRAVALYLGSLASMVVVVGVGAAYFANKADLLAGGGSPERGVFLLVAGPLVQIGLIVIITTCFVRAAIGEPAKPLLRDARVWLYSALSVWIWLFMPRRVLVVGGNATEVAFFVAFLVVAAQSILLGAICMRTARRRLQVSRI